MSQSDAEAPSFAEATRVFAKIGLLSFGGPAGQIALMHRMLVDERKWLEEGRFLHALNYCMLLPGPEAMQLATYAGWLLHGVRGGLMAGLLFVLPGAAVIIALSALYVLAADAPLVDGFLFGLKAAVLAVVIEALMRVSKRALKGRRDYVIALLAFLAIAAFHVPFPVIILAAGVAGAWFGRAAPMAQAGIETEADMPEWTRPTWRRFVTSLAVWGALWFVPLAALYLTLGPSNLFTQQASFFSVMATVTFGGAYAVLAWVAQQAVQVYGWLSPDDMLTGLGLAETTPGPLILVLVFVGYVGGAKNVAMDIPVAGILGALVALWFTFVPCFLWIFVGAPYVETLRKVEWLRAALAAITAAVVGIIANLALWFGLHVLFATVGEVRFGPVSLAWPDITTFNPWAAAIALGAGLALLRFHANMIATLAAAGLAGVAVKLLGF